MGSGWYILNLRVAKLDTVKLCEAIEKVCKADETGSTIISETSVMIPIKFLGIAMMDVRCSAIKISTRNEWVHRYLKGVFSDAVAE